MVCEFESRVGLCADSSEPGACFRFCVSLSLSLSPTHPCLCLFLSQNTNIKKIFKTVIYWSQFYSLEIQEWRVSYKGPNSIMRAILLFSHYLPKAPPPNTITLELGLQQITSKQSDHSGSLKAPCPPFRRENTAVPSDKSEEAGWQARTGRLELGSQSLAF